MTSTQEEIEVSYDVSNAFFELWLDKNMHYTSAVFDRDDMTLEEAQENKAKWLYEFAEVTPDKTVLDIGSGWGSMIDYCVRRGCKEGHGITLSTEQLNWAKARNLPNAKFILCDYKDYAPAEPYDALVSVEMIDHLCSPAQAREGLAVDLYRAYFNKLASWVKPGACFGFQAILRNRIPRGRQDLLDLQFTADIIFPGGLNPRLEELIQAVNPSWEILQLNTRRTHYGRTTGEWLRRMREHEAFIRGKWGDKVYDEYDRYLSTCVKGFANHWSSDVQMKLVRI
jgi:cyclopropane-fatty-acyl-phospholipid synthase